MKPSHLQTPRLLNDCTFTAGYRSAAPYTGFLHALVGWVSLVGMIGVVGAILLGLLP